MSEPRGQLRKEHLTSRGAPIFADWMIIMRNVSPACMGVLRDVLGCPGVTSVLTGHRVCGMSDDDGSDIMVSPSRYSIFRNAVRTSRGAYFSVNPRGEGLAKASMVHLFQDDKPEKVA